MAKSIPLTLALVLVGASAAHADTLLLDGIEMNNPTVDMRPRPGMSMTAVESTHGAPAERHAAVGGTAQAQPPITRWDYPSFSVYFEHDRVIHAVARRQ
jgi:hypothetical protein